MHSFLIAINRINSLAPHFRLIKNTRGEGWRHAESVYVSRSRVTGDGFDLPATRARET
jgi:hypothetical protein